jgi:hypothetical protein
VALFGVCKRNLTERGSRNAGSDLFDLDERNESDGPVPPTRSLPNYFLVPE